MQMSHETQMSRETLICSENLAARDTASDLIYLTACSLHGVNPDEKNIKSSNAEDIYNLAKRHSLSAIVYSALRETSYFKNAGAELIRQWKEAKEKCVRKNILMDVERKQILDEFEKMHIWYMPLKGIIVKTLYPKDDMRQMSDNDILYDSRYRKEVRKLFKERGYAVHSFAGSCHDGYEKKPVYRYEMHNRLFSANRTPKMESFFKTVEGRLVADENGGYERRMTNEDFYIYLTAHAYKHYLDSGTGIRTLTDFYVVNKKYAESLDWNYVFDCLKQLDIFDFEEKCRHLSDRLFGEPLPADLMNLPVEEQEIFSRLYYSGTSGIIENNVQRSLELVGMDADSFDKSKRVEFYFKCLFPGMEWCKRCHPFFYRHPVLIPILIAYRVIYAVTADRKKTFQKIKAVHKMTRA